MNQDQNCVSVPVFRLLGPCPIHNYDDNKYSSDDLKSLGLSSAVFTLEPYCHMGSNTDIVRWMFDCYYGEEALGFAYAQIGQENGFLFKRKQVLDGTRMQIEQLLERGDIEFKKMRDTGEIFKARYPDKTPATSVVALNNFDSMDVQSVYYDSHRYTANLFRFEEKIFFRSLFLFDDSIEDIYLKDTCTTFDAIYENLPIVDTRSYPDELKKQCGLEIASDGSAFEVKKIDDGVLKVTFGDCAAIFYRERIEIYAHTVFWHKYATKASVVVADDGLTFEYKGHNYRLSVYGASLTECCDGIRITSIDGKITLCPQR